MRWKNFSRVREERLNRKYSRQQTDFVAAVEAIGDILVVNTRWKTQNQTVEDRLIDIEKLIKQLLVLKTEDPERFSQVLLSEQFKRLYDRSDKDALLRLSLSPDRYAVTFSAAINQILRVHEAAIDSGNETISRFSTYRLTSLLGDLTTTSGNEFFVKQLLMSLSQLSDTAIEHNDISLYSATVHWYVDIVFRYLGEGGEEFDLSYLDQFNQHLFLTTRRLISQGNGQIFQALVSYLSDGIRVPIDARGKIWKYGHIVLEADSEAYGELNRKYMIQKRIGGLERTIKEIETKSDLDGWLSEFSEIEAILQPYIPSEKLDESQELAVEIKQNAVNRYKYRSLLGVVFAVGAYCLFKGRPDFVRFLWEYQQPPDSDAVWIGEGVVPRSANDVIGLYFSTSLIEKEPFSWDGHHGHELYFKQYFLLLLGRTILASKSDLERLIGTIDISTMNTYRLSDIQYSVEGLTTVANDLVNKPDMLLALGFVEPVVPS
jgi:hypothetical protein